jgi:hypothetical protein
VLLACALVMFLVTLASAEGVRLNARPEFAPLLVVVSQQRSGSSHLTAVLGQHPCMVDSYEVMGGPTPEWLDPLQLHKATGWSERQRLRDPMGFLEAAHAVACEEAPPECGGRCTLVWKQFEWHNKGKMDVHAQVLTDPGVRVLLLERDPELRWCSYWHALHTKDWAHTPTEHTATVEDVATYEGWRESCLRKAANQQPPKFRPFKEAQTDWFANVRSTLRLAGKPFFEVPFDASVSACKFYSHLLPQLMLHAGQPPELAVIDDPDVASCSSNAL